MVGLKDLYFTIAEAAKELNVSRQTIYRWIEDNKIPTEKIGGIVLVEKKEIQKRVEKNFIESFSKTMEKIVQGHLRKKCHLSEKDILKRLKDEDGYVVYILTHDDGKSEKIKVGGISLTLSMSRKEESPSITDIEFEDLTRTEYYPKKQGGKKEVAGEK